MATLKITNVLKETGVLCENFTNYKSQGLSFVSTRCSQTTLMIVFSFFFCTSVLSFIYFFSVQRISYSLCVVYTPLVFYKRSQFQEISEESFFYLTFGIPMINDSTSMRLINKQQTIR